MTNSRLEELVHAIEEVGDISGVMELVRLAPEGANWRTPLTGDSLLHLAVRRNDTALTKALLDLGANPNARSDEGQTPLHYAAKNLDSGDIVSALVFSGAGLDVRDNNQQTPLYLAARRGNLVFADRLLRAGVQLEMRAIIRFGWVDVAALLFESGRAEGVELNVLVEDAIKANSSALVQLLLDKGANANGAGGLSPLFVAMLAETPSPAIAQILLERGANPKATDARSRSLLSVAQQMADANDQYQQNYRRIAQLLIQHGASD